jgi:hypothetical protein
MRFGCESSEQPIAKGYDGGMLADAFEWPIIHAVFMYAYLGEAIRDALELVVDAREAAKDALRHLHWKKVGEDFDNCSGAAQDAITRTNWNNYTMGGSRPGQEFKWEVSGSAPRPFPYKGNSEVVGGATAWFEEKK